MDNRRCIDRNQFCSVSYWAEIYERIDSSTTSEYNNRKVNFVMSDVEFKKHRVFRETQDVIFYDISVEDSNASDLVYTRELLFHLQTISWVQNNFMSIIIK